MKLMALFTFILLFLLFIPTVKANDVTACSELNESGSFLLKNNIDTTSTYCIEINHNDTVLDLSGLYINSSCASGIAHRIAITVGRTNNTLHNITIRNGTIEIDHRGTGQGEGINFYSGDYGNITLENLTIIRYGSSAGFCMELTDIDTATIENVKCNETQTTDAQTFGIWIPSTSTGTDIDIYNSIFVSEGNIYWTPILLGSLTSNVYGCGITYNGTIADLGTNNYITTEACESGYPKRYDLQVGVFSSSEYENATGCPLDLNATVKFAGIRKTIPNLYEDSCCYDNGNWYGCWYYNFSDISTGTYTLEVTKSGYRDYEATILLDTTNIGHNVYLQKYDKADVQVYVKNTTDDYLINAKGTLYYNNASLYESYHVFDPNPQYTSSVGKLIWRDLPLETYFYTVTRTGYSKYISPIFALKEDRNFTTTLEATAIDITLTLNTYCTDVNEYNRYNCTVEKDYNFTIAFTGLSSPYHDVEVWIERPDGSVALHQIGYISTDDYTFEITSDLKIFQVGENRIWVEYEDYVSNIASLKIEKAYIEKDKPLLDLPFAELSWVGLFFTPFSITTFMVVGIAGYVEFQAKANGKVFGLVLLIGILALTVLGIYPSWVAIVFFVIAGFIVMNFMMERVGK